MRTALLLLGSALLAREADAHGRMTRLRSGAKTVWTRKGPGYENNPVSSNKSSQFICRNPPKKPEITIRAGNTIEVEWAFSANHLGDGALYVAQLPAAGIRPIALTTPFTHVRALTPPFQSATRRISSYVHATHLRTRYLSYGDDKFFKIANFPEMNLSNNQFHTVHLPAWLPSAEHAVLRWEWYALHVYPTIEFYVQCTDVKIAGGGSPKALSEIKALSYSVTSPSTLPDKGAIPRRDFSNYRDGFNPTVWWQAGNRECAADIEGNCCDAMNPATGYKYGQGGYNACANSGNSPSAVPTPAPKPTPRPTPGPVYPTPPPVIATYAPTPAPARRRRAVTSGGGSYVCPPNSYILSARWPIQDISDCKCAWGYEKSGGDCVKPGTGGGSGTTTTRAPPVEFPTPAPRPTPAPQYPTPQPPTVDGPAPSPSGAPYACPPGSYIASIRWPIQDFSDCKCNWGYTRSGSSCATNGVAFSAAAQVRLAAPAKSALDVAMQEADKSTKCKKRRCKFKCPENAYLASKRWFKGSLSAAKDCACNPGYTWSNPVSRDDTIDADAAPSDQGVCIKLMTVDALKKAVDKKAIDENAYSCPDNSYISSDRWPLQSFDDCSCANGFRRVERYERCDTRSRLEDKFVTHLSARIGGFDSVGAFMRKAEDFKHNIAAATGAALEDVVIDNVTPIEADEMGAGELDLLRGGRRHLTSASGQLEIEYSMLAAVSDQSEAIEERLAATSDFADSTVSRVYSPIVEDAALPQNGGGGNSANAGVVGGALAFCALVVVGAVVAVKRNNARFARMGGPTPGQAANPHLADGARITFSAPNPMGRHSEAPPRPTPLSAINAGD